MIKNEQHTIKLLFLQCLPDGYSPSFISRHLIVLRRSLSYIIESIRDKFISSKVIADYKQQTIMHDAQQSEDIDNPQPRDNLKPLNTKYKTTQFYPKTRTRIANPQSAQKPKPLAINKSSFSQTEREPSFTPSQTYNLNLGQFLNDPIKQHTSFTMKIIDHHMSAKASNLIGKESIELDHEDNGIKFRSKLYDEIEMINKKEDRIKPAPYDHNISERLKAKRRRQLSREKDNNKFFVRLENESIDQLYRSLPQPFVNKKQLSSFNAPSSSYFKSQKEAKEYQKLRLTQQKNRQLKLLQINNVKEQNHQQISQMIDHLTKYSNDVNNVIQSSLNRKSKYKKKKLQPLKVNAYREKMSNNIKDYLSVQRIKIKQMQSHLLSETTNTLNDKRQSQNPSSIQSLSKPLSRKDNKPFSTMGAMIENKNRPVKFVPPFGLYYYRDFIWKVGFGNEMVVEAPVDYQTKVKVYLGKGNNSNLILGLIKRRPWYQITEKYQQANFVWTQIKVSGYFNLQTKSQRKVEYQQIGSPITQQGKTLMNLPTLNQIQRLKFYSYWTRNANKEMKFKQSLKNRSKMMNVKQVTVTTMLPTTRIHNHLINNYVIGNKKALFSLMNKHYTQQGEQVFNYLPLTFHIKNGLQDDEYLKFLNYYYSISKEIKKMEQAQLNNYIYKYNAWIVKPGENTNRGNGIIVCLTLNQVKAILKKKEKHNDGTYKTYILQKYIQKPLLYRKRKFDLRHYMMMSCTNGIIKGYWYKEGYVRTTSAQYTLKFSSGSVHLTNDAVQKQLPDYGKFQKGNKISYDELNQYIKKGNQEFDFFTLILPKMKKIATDLIKASAKLMDPQKRQNNFQVFGLDFMIDEAYNVYLIQCNSNPCLELSCPLLGKIIPRMVENTFRICLDPIFIPPLNFTPKSQQYYENINDENRFGLVYDERTDVATKKQEKQESSEFLANKDFQEEDDTFDDDGEAWDD